MSDERKVSLEEVKAAIELFSHPMCAVLDQHLVACNQAMLQVSGYRRDELIGLHFSQLVPPEARRWMTDIEDRRAKGQVFPELDFATMKARSGEVLPLQLQVSRVPTSYGKTITLASFQVVSEQKAELEFAEKLASVSTLLIAQLSHDEIRNTATQEFARAQLWAGFFFLDNGTLKPLTLVSGPAPTRPDAGYAQDALREHRPVFGAAHDSGEARVVYLPVRHTGGEEVLILQGQLTTRSSGALRLFAEQLAHAYANATLISYLEASHREMGLLLQLARTTSQSLDSASILETAADFAVKLLEAKYCFICLMDESGQALEARAGSSSVRDQLPAGKFEPGSGTVVGRVTQLRAPVVVNDFEAATPDVQFSAALAKRYGARSVLGVPMISRGQLIGALIIGGGRPNLFGLQQVELAQATAWQLALSVANAQLYESLRQSYVVLQETREAMVKQERLAALGELSAIVAHEVRNPLGVIFNAVSSLRKMVPGNEPIVLLDILAEESDRLNRLVGELLDFARPRAPSMQAENVGRLILDALDAASSDPGVVGLRIAMQTDVEQDLPPVPMDARQIRQALVNVAVNAAQSMPKGGALKVRARRDGGAAGGPQLCIDVQDEGPGIDAELLPRIFEPFFTTKAKGTGLGLAVVKRIVEDHKGTVEVHSEQGRGTTFTFRLPMQT